MKEFLKYDKILKDSEKHKNLIDNYFLKNKDSNSFLINNKKKYDETKAIHNNYQFLYSKVCQSILILDKSFSLSSINNKENMFKYLIDKNNKDKKRKRKKVIKNNDEYNNTN